MAFTTPRGKRPRPAYRSYPTPAVVTTGTKSRPKGVPKPRLKKQHPPETRRVKL